MAVEACLDQTWAVLQVACLGQRWEACQVHQELKWVVFRDLLGLKLDAGLLPELFAYKTCVESPPNFSGCMSNVTADIGERVVLNCQVRMKLIFSR